MSDPSTSGDGGDPTRRDYQPIRSMTFIVRVTENETGGLTGVVEHAGTGRKERFEDLAAISRVIASLIMSAPRADRPREDDARTR